MFGDSMLNRRPSIDLGRYQYSNMFGSGFGNREYFSPYPYQTRLSFARRGFGSWNSPVIPRSGPFIQPGSFPIGGSFIGGDDEMGPFGFSDRDFGSRFGDVSGSLGFGTDDETIRYPRLSRLMAFPVRAGGGMTSGTRFSIGGLSPFVSGNDISGFAGFGTFPSRQATWTGQRGFPALHSGKNTKKSGLFLNVF